MNIAFSTLIIFILLAPGFLFIIGYNSSRESINVKNKNIFNEVVKSLAPALILQFLYLEIVEFFFPYKIDFIQLGTLIFSKGGDEILKSTFSEIKYYIAPIFIYNSILFILSYSLGHLSRLIIRFFKMDRKFRFLRFSNKWHYIFTGEYLDFPDTPYEFEDVDLVFAEVLCSVSGKNVIYTGQVIDHYTNEEGEISAIHIRYPFRWFLKEGDQDKNQPFDIPTGKFLVIPGREIINLNIRYYRVFDIKETYSNKKSTKLSPFFSRFRVLLSK